MIVARPGDVVPGRRPAADAADLEVDESALTGESLPVAKSAAATPGADLAERTCMLYEGCTVLAGTGYAVVAAVGDDDRGRARRGGRRVRRRRAAGMQARLAS